MKEKKNGEETKCGPCHTKCSKKICWGVGGGLVLFFIFVFPPIVGSFVEKKYKELFSKVKEESGTALTLDSKFEKGYFSSQAKILLLFKPNPTETGEKIEIPPLHLDVNISHFTGRAHSKVTVDPEKGKPFLTAYKNLPSLDIYTCFSLFGGLKNNFLFSPFESVPSAERTLGVSFAGLEGNLNLDKEMWPSLLELDLKGVVVKDGLLIKKLEKAGVLFKVDRNEKVLNSSLEVFFDKYDDLSQMFGPGIMEIQVKNVDSASLSKIKNTLSDLGQGNASPEDMKMKMMMSAMGILPAFLKHSPSFEISQLKLKTKDGDLLGNAKLVIKDSPGGAINPFALLSNLQIKVNGSAPRTVLEGLMEQVLKTGELKKITDKDALQGSKGQALLKEIEAKAQKERSEKIGELMDKKYLVESKNGLSFSFAFEKGQMTLNDKPFSFRQ